MEVFCSGWDEDNNSASCVPGAISNSNKGVEAVESQTILGSQGQEDCDLGSRKRDQLSEGAIHKLSSSFSMKCRDQEEKISKSNKATELDEMHGSPLQTSAEVDESDIEEEDVKVCDICGDAGREDLLAVCSKCSDGAEHTYCMREMLDKVPEGDWLCEECKINEELEGRKLEHSKMLGTDERSRSLGRTSSVNCELSVKVDSKDLFYERGKMKNVNLNSQVLSKRYGDSFETSPPVKRQALESSMGSPTSSNPNRVTLLSKDNSLKNLDKMKGKPTDQILTGTESTGDSSEIARPPTTNSFNASKGNFVKSNSFSSGNSKLNVKVPDEVLQKQKQGVDAKHGPVKLIAKSMSFKGLGRSSVSEPKVKMLSPKCAPVQELKGQKQGRDRNLFERKSTIKLDNSFTGQTPAITSKRPSRGDNISSLSVLNNRDYKNSQPDEKLATFSKHTGNSVHKFSDAAANIGELKRLSSSCTGGFASVNGTSSSAEAKPSVVSHKEVAVLDCSRASADRSLVGASGAKADVLDNQNEKMLENSFGRFRQGVNGGLVGGNRGLSIDASVLRTKEGLHEDNKLKAAIEAAMQKKHDIYKKNRIIDKSNDLSTSNIQVNHVGDAESNLSRDGFSEGGMHEEDASVHNHMFNGCKQTSIGSMKQFNVYPTDCTTSPVGESVLGVSTIPEQESIWQGGFEIHRSGRCPEFCGGFQAHLSSIASSKVVEVVKKFPQKIVLDEIPRSCAWPVQFKETGAREDNIALYFFAKDHESYLRSYKILLDYLMKHDLALRGNINGFELLVYPSNHLPDKSQCWNNLLFMWGVFRGRRPLCPDNRSGLPETPEISMPNAAPLDKVVASAACHDDSGLHRPLVEDLSVPGSSFPVFSKRDAPASIRSSLQHLGRVFNGDCHNQTCSAGRTCLISPTCTENSRKWPENHSLGIGAGVLFESESAVLKDYRNQYPNLVIERQQSTPEIDRGDHVLEVQKSSSYLVQNRKHIPSHSKVHLVDKQDGGAVVSSGEEQVLDTVDNNICKVKPDNGIKSEQGCVDNIKTNGGEVKLEDDLKQRNGEIDSIRKNDCDKLKVKCSLKQEECVDINYCAESDAEDLHCLQFSPNRHSHVDSASSISQAASAITLQKESWMDGKDSLEGRDETSRDKRVQGGDAFDGCDLYRLPSSFRDSGSTRMHDVSTSSQTYTSNEADDEKQTSANPVSTERYFLLVDSHPAQLLQPRDESLPWKVGLSENEGRLPDGSPNLELALGVEKKQSRSDILPYFAGFGKNNPDRPPDVAPSEEDEDASASLSLSLAFPFSDKERSSRLERPPTNVEQTLAGRHEVNTSLLLFRGSSHK